MNLEKFYTKIAVLSYFVMVFLAGGIVCAQVITSNGTDITDNASLWGEAADTNSTIESITNQSSGGASYLVADYDLGNGSWVSFFNDNLSDVAALGNSFNAFRFYFKSDGLNNNLVFKARTTNEDVYGYSVETSIAQDKWEEVIVYFEDMEWLYNLNENESNSKTAFSNFINSIKSLEYTIEPLEGGLGHVVIDELYAVASATATPSATPTATPSPIMIDDAESGVTGTNNLNSTVSDLAGAVIAIESSPAQGSFSKSVSSSSAGEGLVEKIYQNDQVTQPLDASMYTHLSLQVLVTSTVSANITLELKNATETQVGSVVLQDYLTDGDSTLSLNTWETVRIPLSAFSGVTLSDLGVIVIVLPANTKLYFDNVQLIYYELPVVPGVELLIDSMDTFHTNASWSAGASTQTRASTDSISGLIGQAIKFEYDFPNAPAGEYAYLVRGFGLNARENNSNAFRFRYRGANANNDLEFKIGDSNQTIYQFKLEKVTDTNLEWKTITIPFTSMSYVSGTNKDFNFKNIQKIEFAIAKGDGGSGKFYIDTIEYIQKPDFSSQPASKSIITSFNIDNNPFSPNSGTPEATATFTYSISDLQAKVWLKIYDLNGNKITKIEAPPAATSMTWDGRSDNGYLVRNGLYLYQFVAEGQSRTDRIKNIIAVIR